MRLPRPAPRRLAEVAASFLFALVLAGCDDDGSPSEEPEPEESCAIDITVSGARSGRAQYEACAVTDLYGGRVSAYFFKFGDEPELDWSVSLEIGPSPAHEPSSGVPVEIGIDVQGEGEQPRWASGDGDCLVDLSVFEPREDENLGPGYWLAGSGSCTGPAAPVASSSATGEITIAPFTFQFFARSNE